MEQINTNNLVVDIDKVVPNTYNPKLLYDDNESNFHEFEKIKNSIQIAGQIQPIIVRELEDGKYEIINGFHRWSAMKEIGFAEVEIKNLGDIDFDTAVSRALLTEDTKVPIDAIELGKLLKTVVTDTKPIQYWADLLPYHPDLIKQKIEMIDFDFDQYGQPAEAEKDDDGWLRFKIEDEEDLNIVKKALESASENENDALVEVCRFYLNMADSEKN